MAQFALVRNTLRIAFYPVDFPERKAMNHGLVSLYLVGAVVDTYLESRGSPNDNLSWNLGCHTAHVPFWFLFSLVACTSHIYQSDRRSPDHQENELSPSNDRSLFFLFDNLPWPSTIIYMHSKCLAIKEEFDCSIPMPVLITSNQTPPVIIPSIDDPRRAAGLDTGMTWRRRYLRIWFPVSVLAHMSCKRLPLQYDDDLRAALDNCFIWHGYSFQGVDDIKQPPPLNIAGAATNTTSYYSRSLAKRR